MNGFNIYTETLLSGLSFEMIRVEGGSFELGNSNPARKVNVPTFYIGKYTVTQDLWTEIIGDNPVR